jgi:hypothetical protein
MDKNKPFGIRLDEKTNRSLIELAYLHNTTKSNIAKIIIKKALQAPRNQTTQVIEESLVSNIEQESGVSNG